MKATRLLMILAVLAGCADREEPRVSLGAGNKGAPNDAVHAGVQDAQQGQGDLSPAAKAALDSGNAAYRDGKYEAALKHYRAAAKAAPAEAAPHFGIFMAAQRLGRTAEAAEAQKMINKLSGDTAGVAPHALPPASDKKPPATSQ